MPKFQIHDLVEATNASNPDQNGIQGIMLKQSGTNSVQIRVTRDAPQPCRDVGREMGFFETSLSLVKSREDRIQIGDIVKVLANRYAGGDKFIGATGKVCKIELSSIPDACKVHLNLIEPIAGYTVGYGLVFCHGDVMVLEEAKTSYERQAIASIVVRPAANFNHEHNAILDNGGVFQQKYFSGNREEFIYDVFSAEALSALSQLSANDIQFFQWVPK